MPSSSLNTSPVTARQSWCIWLGVFLVLASLYAFTAQRGCSWGDHGEFQWRVVKGEYIGSEGLCTSHPLYIFLGRLWLAVCPLPDAAWSLNVFSGLGVALVMANLSLILLQLTRDVTISILTVLMLAVSHTPWWLATLAEVHPWSVVGLTLELLLLLRLIACPRWTTAGVLMLVNGLGINIHNFALLPLPVYGSFLLWYGFRRIFAWRQVALACLGWVLGAAPLLAIVASHALQQHSLVAAVKDALVGPWGPQVFGWRLGRLTLLTNAVLVGMNFLGVLLPLALVGVWGLRRLRAELAVALGAITALHVLFVVRYNIADLYTFMLPTLVMTAVCAAHGAALLAQRSPGLRRAVLGGLAFSILLLPSACRSLPRLLQRVSAPYALTADFRYPCRDELTYFIQPWKHHERSAVVFAREAFRTAAPDGLIVADGVTTLSPLLALQATQPGLDRVEVRLFDKADPGMVNLLTQHAARRVFVVRPMLIKYISPQAEITPAGVLHQVRLKQPVPQAG